jgi:hypothetical protein
MRAARIGLVRFFCSAEVRAEVLEHLPELTSRHATSNEAIHVWHKHYAPLITILGPSGIPTLSAQARRVLHHDPDDTPTALVIDMVRPQTVLSEDHHLSADSPTGRNWTQWAAAYRDQSEAQAIFVAVRFSGGFTVLVAVSSIEALIARLLKVDWRILLGVIVAVGIGSGIAIAHPTSRTWLKERRDATGAWAQEHLAESVTAVVEALVALDQQSKAAGRFLEEHALVHESPNLVQEYIFEVLARTHAYLTAREISLRMQDLGYEPRGEHPERYVAKVLRENPHLFERHPSWRWGFASSLSEVG